MNPIDQDRVLAPHWGWFRRIWMVVTVGLVSLLVLMTVFGFGPGGRRCPAADCAPGAAALPVPAAVVDAEAPNITLAGDNPVFLELGQMYEEAGVSALDDTDGELPVGSSGAVDTGTPGRYTLTYTATDRAGNTATLTRQVIVDGGDASASSDLSVPPAVPSLPRAKLYFALGSAGLPADATTTLGGIIDYLAATPEASVVISGFHDASGNVEVNQRLAKARAETVRDLLGAQGVSEDRITLEKPQETEGSGSADEARRVEVRVLP